MITADRVAVILLAAGSSSRFGHRDKLSAPLGDRPLGLHAARTLADLPFAARIVVTREDGPDFAAYGFAAIVNPRRDDGQSGSIRIGVAQARLTAPEAILIALADMPFVTAAHIRALLDRFDARDPIVASIGAGAAGPPALFGARWFDALETLDGDRGARAMVRGAALVTAASSVLVDIDTQEDLATASLPTRHPTAIDSA